MCRNELVAMIEQLGEYQVEQIHKMAEGFLSLNEELNDIAPKAAPAARTQPHVLSGRAFLAESNGISV